jgi:hypothetical protein
MRIILEPHCSPAYFHSQVLRSIVRFLKGHGKDYAFDEATWRHYRRQVQLSSACLAPRRHNFSYHTFALLWG